MADRAAKPEQSRMSPFAAPRKYGPITFVDTPTSALDRIIGIEVIVKSTPDCERCKKEPFKRVRLVQIIVFDLTTGNPTTVDLTPVDEFGGKTGVPKREVGK